MSETKYKDKAYRELCKELAVKLKAEAKLKIVREDPKFELLKEKYEYLYRDRLRILEEGDYVSLGTQK